MAAAAKTDGKQKVVKKTIAKKKAKSAPVKAAPAVEKALKEEKEAEKEEEKAEEKEEAAAAPATGKGKAKAKGKAEAKAQSRKTKARRLEEAQARVDAEDEDDEGSAAAAASDEPRGVIYVGHIPDGFFEPQMKKYFSQFGKVTRVRHSRSKKNAASRGYGWIEFAEEDVAKIAQQTMNGYMMFGKKMVCEMVPPDKVHPRLFKNANKRMIDYSKSRRRKAREAHNNRPTAEVDGETIPRMTLRQAARRGKADKRLASVLKGMEVSFDLGSANLEASEGDDVIVASRVAKRSAPKETPKSPKAKSATSPKVKAATPPASPKAKAKAKAEAKAAKKKKKA